MSQELIHIIEDENEIALLIRDYLEDDGFQVMISTDGQSGLEKTIEKKPDLVILDLMLPKIDGFEVCRNLRKDLDIPVIILSSKSSDMDKVLALGIGADDYVTKPFSPVVLLARVKAHLRRASKQLKAVNEDVLNFGELKIYTESYSVTIDDVEIAMTNKEFELLKYLAQNAGRVVSKDQIINAVWGNNYFGDDNTVPVHMYKIREKIEKIPSKPKYIQTVWGIGYKFIGGASHE
ncbi:MAG: response regulator transcription factor [Firmicutes bacterium]|jgi:DNA-binding response OmpR family regulator|nr:response regulator transcription factor [Bacillota bacterium]